MTSHDHEDGDPGGSGVERTGETADAKRGRAARTKSKLVAQLVTHREVAEACSVDTETLRDWVAKGEFPEPHSVIERTLLYDVEIINFWLKNRQWPPVARFKTGEGKGRKLR